jgi:hypothetical protein
LRSAPEEPQLSYDCWFDDLLMVSCVWAHFERAFAPGQTPYDATDVYELAVVASMLIRNRWVGDGDREAAFGAALALAEGTDPVAAPVTMSGVLNIVAVATIMDADRAAASACEGDFLPRCAAFGHAGGWSGEHNATMVKQWIAALPMNDAVGALAAVVADSAGASHGIERALRQFVGWRRGE